MSGSERLGDWLVFLVRWDQLRRRWLSAEPDARLVLTDGRPAVLAADGRSVETVPLVIWHKIRAWARERHQWLSPTPQKRTRRCLACGNLLELRKEYARAWTFACPICKTVEIYGKAQVGGTEGAGEKEPDS